MYKRILVPIDGSDTSERGLQEAIGLARDVKARLVLLHVIDASKQGWGIINHDLFLSNAQIRQVIRSAIDGRPSGGA